MLASTAQRGTLSQDSFGLYIAMYCTISYKSEKGGLLYNKGTQA